MNDESSSFSAAAATATASKATSTAAARAVLARRSNEQIPLSLGKGSLRLRLEAYYSLISPETLSNRTVWLRKYDQIYEKYGGTHQGERKLATKLAKKYGTAVRLLLASSAQGTSVHRGAAKDDTEGLRNESWYRLRPRETGSGVVDFLSPDFDPVMALTRASETQVFSANPWMTENSNTILDNVGKCAALLPQNDPLYRDDHLRAKLRNAAAAAAVAPGMVAPTLSSFNKTADTKQRARNNNIHPFEAIATHLDSGPHSFLFRCREERRQVTVVVRYVNMVRGTLSGTLIAFDKHMNMILRDVEEVYSPRLVDDEEHSRSNLELEMERRRRIRLGEKESSSSPLSLFGNGGKQQQHQNQPGAWNVRRRQMKQLMVRGDMVVSIYETTKANKNVTRSRYHKRQAEEQASNRSSDRNTAKRWKGNESHNKSF